MNGVRVVFVADDLGVAPGVDAGIAAAAAAGVVREASLCVTGGDVEAGLRTARELGLGVGLHLSLTLGRALTGPIRGVTDGGGAFLPLRRVLLACLRSAVDRDGIAREIAAQLQRLADLGVPTTHANGHHHVHVFPVVRDVAFAAFARAGVRWTRLPAEPAGHGARFAPARLLLAHFARAAAPRASAHGLRWLPFTGLATEGRADFAARATRVAARLGPGPSEWMVHPRRPDDLLRRLDPAACTRPSAEELAWLSDGAAVRGHGLVPVAFADVEAAPVRR